MRLHRVCGVLLDERMQTRRECFRSIPDEYVVPVRSGSIRGYDTINLPVRDVSVSRHNLDSR